MHENLEHTVVKHFTKKKGIQVFKQSLPTIVPNSKHLFRFHIKQYWQFQGVTTKWCQTLFQSSYQTLTCSESYYQIRANTFSEFISNITDTFRELLSNNMTHFSRHQTILTFDLFRAHVKQYSHFHRVITKQ